MSQKFSFFLLLPEDLQIQIMMKLSNKTIYRLCRTGKHFTTMCKDERLWKFKFLELVEHSTQVQTTAEFTTPWLDKWINPGVDKPNTNPNNLYQRDIDGTGASYLDKTRTLLSILHPQIVVSVIVEDLTILETTVAPDEPETWPANDGAPPEEDSGVNGIIVTYPTSSVDEAQKWLIRDYNAKIEPVRSTVLNLIEKFLTDCSDIELLDYSNAYDTEKDLFEQFQKYDPVITKDQFKIFWKRAYYADFRIRFRRNHLFRFRNTAKTHSLFQPRGYHDLYILFTVTGLDSSCVDHTIDLIMKFHKRSDNLPLRGGVWWNFSPSKGSPRLHRPKYCLDDDDKYDDIRYCQETLPTYTSSRVSQTHNFILESRLKE